MTLFNGERVAGIRRRNQSALAAALNRPFGEPFRDNKRVLWLYNPHESHLARSVPHDALIYDIMDEYRGFPWSPPDIAEEEAELIEAADWVFAGTGAIHDAKRPMAEGKITCELSGVDADFFRRKGDERPQAPESLRRTVETFKTSYKRLLGYAGVIDLRVDQDLLVQSARRHPDWGFILLGPATTNVGRLHEQSNIHLPGQQPYGWLPTHYHSWDCALIPFVENELTRHINPTKILEYAAAGVPIVTRALPDVKRFYAEGAFLYETVEEWEGHLETILAGDAPAAERPPVAQRMEKAREWAQERSWDAIAARMLSKVRELCKE